jgi:hypothetical protein
LYDTSKTSISLGILVELNEGMHEYKDSYVLAGGWAPYFITKGQFNHCGSIDIDLVLKPQIFQKYETIRDSITKMGFNPTSSPFRFKRDIKENFSIELDFLSEPEAAQKIPQQFIQIQDDLSAVMIAGSSLVFRFNFETKFSGKLLDGSELKTQMKIANIVSMVSMKGHALGRAQKLEKDCYDLYAICGFSGKGHGSPSDSAQLFNEGINEVTMTSKERTFVKQALDRLRDYFASENGRGPVAVSRFYGMDETRRVDSYQRVSTFMKLVQRL